MLPTLTVVGISRSQPSFPKQPLSLIVPFPPGGVADIVARSLAVQLQQQFGQPALVVNRPGASGAIGAAAVARLSTEDMMLAVPASSKYHTVADLVADAKRRPGVISYASSGNYGVYHIATEMFTDAAKIRLNHISYGGGAPAMLALISGQVDLSLMTRSVGLAQLQSGKVRPLAAWAAAVGRTTRTCQPSSKAATASPTHCGQHLQFEHQSLLIGAIF